MTTRRFGISLSTSAARGRGAGPVADARQAERLGFDFVTWSDHPGADGPTYETWTLLTWVAAATERITVMPKVLGVPFRSPALLAKMAESLDRLSAGRLILGLGAGSAPHELGAFAGVEPGRPGHLVDGLADATRIIRGLWSETDFRYQGRVYGVEGATLDPRPDRPIPIWMGTFGDRSLAITGSLADGWIPSLGYAGAQALPAMREKVLAAALAAGRRPEDITCALNLEIRVQPDADPEPDVVAGPPDYLAERLADLGRVGFTTFNFVADPGDLETLATAVVPQLSAVG